MSYNVLSCILIIYYLSEKHYFFISFKNHKFGKNHFEKINPKLEKIHGCMHSLLMRESLCVRNMRVRVCERHIPLKIDIFSRKEVLGLRESQARLYQFMIWGSKIKRQSETELGKHIWIVSFIDQSGFWYFNFCISLRLKLKDTLECWFSQAGFPR